MEVVQCEGRKYKAPYIESFANNDFVSRLGCYASPCIRHLCDVQIDGPLLIQHRSTVTTRRPNDPSPQHVITGHLLNRSYLRHFGEAFPESRLRRYFNGGNPLLGP
mgnify:FL=1